MKDWTFHEAAGLLCRPGRSIQLTPKAAAVLACLMRNAGDVVSVQQVLDEVWRNVHVSPDLVRGYILDLRRALEDDAGKPRFIQTVRGRGFRLTGGVEAGTVEAPPDRTVAQDAVRPTIAVLKPVAYGGGEAGPFAHAVASDIINHLARFQDIGVVARHSSFSVERLADLRAFMREVGARYVLESDVGFVSGCVRVRTQLIEGESGRTFWADAFDFDERGMTGAVERIVEAVVGALTGWNGELHRAEFMAVTRKRSEALNAFEHFVLARDLDFVFEAQSVSRSLFHLERAVRLEPTFARGWLTYSITLRWAYDVMPARDEDYLVRSRDALSTAYKLAPRDAMTLALVALELARGGELGSALEHLARAEEAMANDADAMVCVATCTAVLTDRADRAVSLYSEGVRRNPTPPRWFKVVESRIAFLAGDFRRSIACARTGPRQMSSLIFRCLSHAMLDEREQAALACADLRASYPDADFARFADQFPIADASRRKEYEVAVRRLESLLRGCQNLRPRRRIADGRDAGTPPA